MTQLTTAFSKGPKIAIHFLQGKKETFRVCLLESTIFTACFFVDFPPLFHQKLLEWLLAYSKKEPLPSLDLPRQNLPPFSEKVLKCMGEIPFGSTLSYGEIAKKAGSPGASRAVGTICRLNPWPLFLPCHRVLPKSGEIGGFAFGASIKKALLEFEGIL